MTREQAVVALVRRGLTTASNVVTGTVGGTVIQAGDIQGGLRF
ncbi:hypothetical protein GCM10012275_63200 [Longimycelium tulufanense]|uniref:Uncharacterized protein n=1 Tax=Longimycelium tulufanense TaxID=907463 RepID=A0A8J3CEU3_9PSEU|nr:hypothetical protein [Longimycelium tulufanense]GGM83947.1 hypothetical protein GCM10012275_63200 [Longimycelium tulufanense]